MVCLLVLSWDGELVNINWVATIPSDGSAVGIGAKDVRLQKYAVAEGLRESLNLGNKIDPIKQGAPRPYIDIQSNSSNINVAQNAHLKKNVSSFTRGTLYFASDTSRLLMWTSINSVGVGGSGAELFYQETTYQIGTPRFIEHGTTPTNAVHIETSGFKKFSTPDGAQNEIRYSNVSFDSPPQVYVWSSNSQYLPIVRYSSTTDFGVWLLVVSGAASDMTLFWRASGTSGGVV